MKMHTKALLFLATELLMLLSITVYMNRVRLHNFYHRNDVPTLQQRSAHMVKYLTKKHNNREECSGTAIGPHAILTAAHCNDAEEFSDTLNFDLSLTDYHILAEKKDGHDHVIYLLDGPAFRHFLPVDSLVGLIAPPLPGEHVYMFGDGESNFPPRRLDGVEDATLQAADSDVDIDMGMHWYTLAIVPGDSGAAIYGEDGRVLGLNTWADGENSASMSLNFTPTAIHFAHEFSLETFDASDNPETETHHGTSNDKRLP
jgi:hypothetical protein